MPRSKKSSINSNPLETVDSDFSNSANSDYKEINLQENIMNQTQSSTVDEVKVSQDAGSHDDGSLKSADYKKMLANTTVKNWSQWSVAAGFIPVPLADTAAISGIQIKMIYDLCKIYNVPFEKEVVVGVIGSLAGGSIATAASTSIATDLIRFLPVIGTPLSLITQPAIAFATTYALGTVFVAHFEDNGGLGNLDISKMRSVFKEQFESAKRKFKFKKNVDDLEPAAV
jgi:uncharacterized protein (DUF697 family)